MGFSFGFGLGAAVGLEVSVSWCGCCGCFLFCVMCGCFSVYFGVCFGYLCIVLVFLVVWGFVGAVVWVYVDLLCGVVVYGFVVCGFYFLVLVVVLVGCLFIWCCPYCVWALFSLLSE